MKYPKALKDIQKYAHQIANCSSLSALSVFAIMLMATHQVLAQTPTVYVAAGATSDIDEDEGPPWAYVIFTRSMETPEEEITVNYSISGTATNGVDYETLSGSIVIGSGQEFGFLSIEPIQDFLLESQETVTITIESGSGYTATPSSGTVYINDDGLSYPVVSVAAQYEYIFENETSGFTVSRTESYENAVTVYYTIGGLATNGDDYVTLSGSVEIGAWQSSAVIDLIPILDYIYEGSENVTITIDSGPYYHIESGYGYAWTVISDW